MEISIGGKGMKKHYMYGHPDEADEYISAEYKVPQMGPQFKLARAYVPYQVFGKIYDPVKSLMRGTIFPELYESYPKKKRSVEDE